MFNNILVPTDLSPKSIKSLEIALSMAKEGVCRVTLLHVVEKIEDDEGQFEEFYDKLAVRAQEKMQNIVDQCSPGSVPVLHKITYGKRVSQIVQFALKNEIDLIILSSHRIENMEATDGWATISYRVGILAPCPVMMVK